MCAHIMRFTYYRISLNMRLNNNLTKTKNKNNQDIYTHNIYV